MLESDGDMCASTHCGDIFCRFQIANVTTDDPSAFEVRRLRSAFRGQPGYRLRWAFTVKPLIGDGYLHVASPRGFEPRFSP